MRFRAEQHLRRQTEIRAVREQGRRIDCRAFTMWWKQRSFDPPGAASTIQGPRVCVIAPARAVGGAVQRNRAKRRLREVFRQQQQQVPAGCDLLLIARDSAATWPLEQLTAKFTEACRQLNSGPSSGKK
jgi:ribonuclease P protein component